MHVSQVGSLKEIPCLYKVTLPYLTLCWRRYNVMIIGIPGVGLGGGE